MKKMKKSKSKWRRSDVKVVPCWGGYHRQIVCGPYYYMPHFGDWVDYNNTLTMFPHHADAEAVARVCPLPSGDRSNA